MPRREDGYALTWPRVLALAGSLWLAAALPSSEALAQRASVPRGACTAQAGHSVSPACRHFGFVTRRRSRGDVHVRQAAAASRALLYPPRLRPGIYPRQPAPRSFVLLYPQRASLWQSRAPAALHMTQLPHWLRTHEAQPHPLHISRPCFTRYADPLGCPAWSPWPSDALVEALIRTPSARSVPLLWSLGLPVIPDVPPIVIINGH